MKSLRYILLSWMMAAVGGACDVASGVDPALRSGPLVAQLEDLSSADVTDGVLEKLRTVGKQDDNRWTQFVAGARQACGGQDPELLTVDRVGLELVDDRSSIVDLSELFAGSVDIVFSDDLNATTVTVASRLDVTGSGPVRFNSVAGDNRLLSMTPAMLTGDFSVGLRGAVNPEADAWSLTLKLPIEVRAFCSAPALP